MNNTQQLLNDYIVDEFLQGEARAISPNENLIEGGIIDSLAIMMLINYIEGQFSVYVQPEDVIMENFESVDAISRLIEEKR